MAGCQPIPYPFPGLVALRNYFRARMSIECIPLSGDPEQRGDKLRLPSSIITAQPFDLTFPHHVHRFNAFECSFRRMERLEALRGLHLLLDEFERRGVTYHEETYRLNLRDREGAIIAERLFLQHSRGERGSKPSTSATTTSSNASRRSKASCSTPRRAVLDSAPHRAPFRVTTPALTLAPPDAPRRRTA